MYSVIADTSINWSAFLHNILLSLWSEELDDGASSVISWLSIACQIKYQVDLTFDVFLLNNCNYLCTIKQ